MAVHAVQRRFRPPYIHTQALSPILVQGGHSSRITDMSSNVPSGPVSRSPLRGGYACDANAVSRKHRHAD